jgi:hypothetical protein
MGWWDYPNQGEGGVRDDSSSKISKISRGPYPEQRNDWLHISKALSGHRAQP